MKKILLLVLPLCLAMVCAFNNTLTARPQYDKQFQEKYNKPDSKDANEKKLSEELKKVTETKGGKTQMCNACHAPPPALKKERNDYGKSLGKLLEKNEKDEAKIKKALEEVEKEKPNDKSPSYGELLKKGALPSEPKEAGK